MDYEKKYKDALERANSLLSGNELGNAWIYKLFPELKESEDEKIIHWIRKELESKYVTDNKVNNVMADKALAWLKKQGEKKHKFIIGDIISNNNAIYRVDNIVKNAIGQDCYFLVNVESEKYGTRYLKLTDSDGKTHNSGEITWICKQVDAKFEKQDKQKTINDTDEDIVEAVKDTSILDIVERKFHKGDWIAHDAVNFVFQIAGVGTYGYTVHDKEGNTWTVTFGNEGNYHLWAITDAKDGDVLVTVDNERPFIYKGCLDPNHPDSPVAYCGINCEGYFCRGGDNFDHWWTEEKVQPSTKEQRDFLFSKIKEAGYEWDAEKKELKKIEFNPDELIEESYRHHADDLINMVTEKPAWSEKDELILEAIYYTVNGYEESVGVSNETMINWLKSLKNRVQHQWKPNKEQMRALHDLNLTGNMSYAGQGQKLIDLYNDLKKLREE